jgi:hypothetical protein
MIQLTVDCDGLKLAACDKRAKRYATSLIERIKKS